VRTILATRDRKCRCWQELTHSRRNGLKTGLGSFRHSPAPSAQNRPTLSAARAHRRLDRLRHKALNNLHNQRNPWMRTVRLDIGSRLPEGLALHARGHG
jgi:hypothetical protein